MQREELHVGKVAFCITRRYMSTIESAIAHTLGFLSLIFLISAFIYGYISLVGKMFDGIEWIVKHTP